MFTDIPPLYPAAPVMLFELSDGHQAQCPRTGREKAESHGGVWKKCGACRAARLPPTQKANRFVRFTSIVWECVKPYSHTSIGSKSDNGPLFFFI